MDEAPSLAGAGLPEHGLEAAYTDADTEALSTLIRVVRTGLIDFDMAVNLTRAVGQTMARLADWEVATLVHPGRRTRGGRRRHGQPDRLGTASGRRDRAALRGAAGLRVAASPRGRDRPRRGARANEEDLNTVQLTVGFADIVSFTALSTGSPRTASATSWSCSSRGVPTWSPRPAAG